MRRAQSGQPSRFVPSCLIKICHGGLKNLRNNFIKILDDGDNLSQKLPIRINEWISMQQPELLERYVDATFMDKASSLHLRHYRLRIDWYFNNINYFACQCDWYSWLMCQTYYSLQSGMQYVWYSWMEWTRSATGRQVRVLAPCVDGRWVSCAGWLSNLRRHTRCRYHWAIKQVKRNPDDLMKKARLHNLLMSQFLKAFWTLMKILKRARKEHFLWCFYSDEDIANRFKEIQRDRCAAFLRTGWTRLSQ